MKYVTPRLLATSPSLHQRNTSSVSVLSVRDKRQPLGMPENHKHTKPQICPCPVTFPDPRAVFTKIFWLLNTFKTTVNFNTESLLSLVYSIKFSRFNSKYKIPRNSKSTRRSSVLADWTSCTKLIISQATELGMT